ncbi:MAG: transglycosylase domain-containing protein [Pseudomonadota bacterium]
MKRTFKIFSLSLAFLLLSLSAFFFIIYHQASKDASTRIERGVIDKIIFSESPVYYDDGQTPIGVFFEKVHRKYIHFRDIPKNFIKAIVAAEDRNFFSHPGFDIKAILRAFIANIKAGKIIQGGSTITQQTAKNIFKREKKSYMTKLRELMQALLLEKRYTKEEILEVYANQFFVTGFGRGLRVASEYFFSKEAEDLDLVESAFIAGLVKGPFRYNPFTKRTETEKKEALRLAKLRKDYVLANMYQMGFITKEQYLTAKEKDIPFKEGKITYRLNVVLDYIREQLLSDFFKNILAEQGIENIATSGIKIYTSINKEIQEGALAGIRKNLPLLDAKLSGYDVGLAQPRYQAMASEGLKKSEDSLPFLSRITQIHNDKENPGLIVSWGDGGGLIDYEGLRPIGEAWLKWKMGNWALFDKRHVPGFLKNFKVGDLVPVQFMEGRENPDQTRLMLSKVPGLDGGIIVIRDGMIKAMVGGFFDRFFNRAVDAKRQLGSIFKPIVYTAALQLNWNSLDPLINMKDIFRFENTSYVPEPDHEPKAKKVSLIWSGVKSENLAAVWLLYHLTDQLNMSEFRQVAKLVGLDKKEDETYQDYAQRIRDKHGVVVDQESVSEAAFEEAKRESRSEVIFGGYEDALDNLSRLHYFIDPKDLDLMDPDQFQIYRLDFHRLRSLNFEMKRRFKRIKDILKSHSDTEDPNLKNTLYGALRNLYLIKNGNDGYRVVYAETADRLNLPNIEPVQPEWFLGQTEGIAFEKIWIDGLIPSEIIDLLGAQFENQHKRLLAHRRYDFEVLSKVIDFRILVNLLYVTRLANKMGITTPLDPVLSFPLGANSISIMEAALAYQTIMTGHVYPLAKRIEPGMVPVITRIEDRKGETLWEYRQKPQKILSDRVSGLVTEILHMVMEKGTGQGAKDAVGFSIEVDNQVIGFPIPAYGKTGTANRFTNSSFVGFIPVPKKDSEKSNILEGYVIASYVGYDDNRPMKSKHMAIYGASGALPLWIETANAIAKSAAYKKNLQIADLAFDIQSLFTPHQSQFQFVPISPVTGLPLWRKDGMVSEDYPQVLSYVDLGGDHLELKRLFEPFAGALYEE